MRCRPCFFCWGGRVVEMRCGENGNGGRVAERSESSNPMIASGNHTDSNGDRPYGVRRWKREAGGRLPPLRGAGRLVVRWGGMKKQECREALLFFI